MVRWVVGLILHGVDPLGYFSFQPVLHDWCNKGCGMCYPVCGMVHIKEPLLLMEKISQCGGSGFPLSLSEWSFTICLMPYNRKYNVLSASLNKTFPSFLYIGKVLVLPIFVKTHGCHAVNNVLKHILKLQFIIQRLVFNRVQFVHCHIAISNTYLRECFTLLIC